MMKRFIVSVSLVLFAAAFSGVFAQATPAGAGAPPGGGDKNLSGDGIKMRSVELERIKREAQIEEAASFAPINSNISAKFPQIKEDFEGLQILEAAIIKAYTTGKTIDYGLIETSADGISKKAKRLDTNLFAANVESKENKSQNDKSKEDAEKKKSIRDLIVGLDTAIGDFVSSKFFGNIKVIEPEVAIKTRTDLLSVLRLSEQLSIAAQQLK